MRRPDQKPLDPVTQAELDAIDATLQGAAVEPVYAELAEIALLLEAERPPAPREAFTDELDARVARRFAPDPPTADRARSRSTPAWPARVLDFVRRPAVVTSAVAAVAVVAIAVFVVPNINLSSGASSSSSASGGSSASAGAGLPSPLSGSAKSLKGTAGRTNGHLTGPALSPPRHSTSKSPVSTRHSASNNEFGGNSGTAGTTASLATRKVKQSTQIELGTSNDHVAAVAQEVLNATAEENTIVEHSHVSSNSSSSGGSFATFTLSVPDGNLQALMDKLSKLPDAHVVSRQQSTQDVTDQYNDDKRALADAQALRTSLLKKLEGAYTTGAIDSLKAQIKNAEADISRDEQRINALDHATSYTTVSVQINAANATHHHHGSHAGFGIGSGANDGLHVLVVAAAVALIVLAALIPIGLVAALLSWIGFGVRQRRRERALNQA
jgi:hypothetical protein